MHSYHLLLKFTKSIEKNKSSDQETLWKPLEDSIRTAVYAKRIHKWKEKKILVNTNFFSNFLHTLGVQTIKNSLVSSGDEYTQILMTPGLPQAMIYKKRVICGLIPMHILLGEIHSSLFFIHSYHPALGQKNNNKQKHYNIRVPEQTSSARKDMQDKTCQLTLPSQLPKGTAHDECLSGHWWNHKSLLVSQLTWQKAICNTASIPPKQASDQTNSAHKHGVTLTHISW